MQELKYSFIIPVFNRPDEIERLLLSVSNLDFERDFEVVVVEDGSSRGCEDVCFRFRESVTINYYYKENSGPGDSRNYGMSRAKGNYFIILDSDCILPSDYLTNVDQRLLTNFTDCFGGPDTALKSFSILQKAINYSMTSVITTGGIRGGEIQLDKFQPRSFNMGISKVAFERSGGFGKIHPGEDPDLTLRLWKLGFKTQLIREAYVYHERRISWRLFLKQVHKFGIARVILNKWHPETSKLIYWFPFLFSLFLCIALIAMLFNLYWFFYILSSYFCMVFIHSTIKNGLNVGFNSVFAVVIQFMGYGTGFILSWLKIRLLNIHEETAFPKMFFK